MKISASKKQLAKIISENGGWRDGVEFSAQDQEGEVFFYETKPTRFDAVWHHHGVLGGDWIKCDKAQPNWHQTIVSREEYFHLHPAPDAYGWIEWNGGECPVEKGVLVDVKWRTGTLGGLCCDELMSWAHTGHDHDIIAYRLHKPEDKFVAKPERTVIEPAPTIEQLAADYRAKRAIAQQAQEEADSHRLGAETALEKLVAAGKAVGLELGVSGHYQELAIKDWMDWLVGDEVSCISTPPGAKCFRWLSGTVSKILDNGVEVVFSDRKCCAYGDMVDKCFKFISRP